MKKYTQYVVIFSLFIVLSSIKIQAENTISSNKGFDINMITKINNLEDLATLFPKTAQEVQECVDAVATSIAQDVDHILKTDKKTFDTTMRAFDITSNKITTAMALMETLGLVSPDEQVRNAALQAEQKLKGFEVELSMNVELYRLIQSYYEHEFAKEALGKAEELLITKYLKTAKRLGLHLSDAVLKQIKQVKKEITALEQEFMVNVNSDDSSIKVSKQELEGVNQDFIDQLPQDGDLYIVSCKLSTYIPVISECSVEATRKKIYIARNAIAYPQNETVLVQLLKKREELATLLGHSSFASLDLDQTSAKSIQEVEKFLLPLAQQCIKKQVIEFDKLKKDLPKGVMVSSQGTMNPWDYAYAYNEYKKKNFAIDESKIAEYFPVQKVIDGIFKIYQDFLGLEFKQVKPLWSWHEDVMLIEIYSKSSKELLGYLFLDLYPRANKYTHACVAPEVVSFDQSGTNCTSVATLITNFPKPSADKPSLLHHDDVVTFFHEFGHAMHHTLSRTKYAGQAGLNVALDFVETPSQMFEQWMYDADMLGLVSSHYKTSESLPKDIIDKKIQLRKSNSGYLTLRQCMIALFSLYLMTNDELSYNPSLLWKSLHEKYLSDVFDYNDSNHWFATFGHLASEGYASKYYGYLWTNVFAHDLFASIKEHAFNAEYSKKVVTMLSAGSSLEPETLLQNFLGRKPNQEAFLSALGLK